MNPATINPATTNPATTAFAELVALLQSAEQTFLTARNQTDDVDISDCYQNLLDLVAIGVDCYIDNSAADPHFTKLVNSYRKMGGDNAHALYDFAPLDGQCTYRVRGNRGGTAYLGITLYGGASEEAVTVHANINTSHLRFDEHGNFSVTIGPGSGDGQTLHLPSLPDTNGVIVRQYFLDTDRSEEALLDIAVIDGPAAPAVVGSDSMAARITALTRFVKGWTAMTPMPWPDAIEAYNQVCPPFHTGQSTGHWSTPDNLHAFGFFKLADNEALLLQGRSPECLYWSCHLWNSCMHTFDYERFACAISGAEVQYDADGSWTLVIAARDPGRPNWIDTAGRGRGFIYFRWLEARETPPPISARVITLGGD